MTRIVLRAILIALIATVGAFSTARAQQISGGVLAGANFANFANADFPADNRTGFRVGGFLETIFTSRFGARLEAAYSMAGVRWANTTTVLDYVEVPLLAKIILHEDAQALSLFVGPALGIKLVGEYRQQGYVEDHGDLVHPWDPRVVLAVEIRTDVGGRDILIGGRFTQGLRPIFDIDDPDDLSADDKNRIVSLGVGLILF